MQFIKQFIREEEGQDIVEYGLVLGLVALAGAGTLALIGGDVTTIMDAVVAIADTAAAAA
jgi:Flp pilus assembly pilin Flp